MLAIEACASNRVPKPVDEVVARIKCGMTTADVERLAGIKLRNEGQRVWGNYVLQQGTTDIWLQFNDGKLSSAQVATLDGLMKMKLWPKKELCAASAAPSGS